MKRLANLWWLWILLALVREIVVFYAKSREGAQELNVEMAPVDAGVVGIIDEIYREDE